MSRERLLAIEGELNTRYLQRSEEIRGLLLATLSGNHIELLGPPGTAKSQLVYDYEDYLIDDTGSDKIFSWLFTKFTTVDEVMGPVSIQGMKEDRYTRITTGKLPQARFAYLDEIYKANSPLLNSLLSILQEGIFYNNGGSTNCPLQMCVGSSNELPDEDEGLTALRDRFLLRYQVNYLQDADVFKDLINLQPKSKVVSKLSGTDLTNDIAEVNAMTFDSTVTEAIVLVWEKLREHGIIISDRRYKQMLKVMAAESWLSGALVTTSDSLIVGEHILWEKPDNLRDVKQIVRSSVNPSLNVAQDYLIAAKEGLVEVNNGTCSSDEQLAVVRQIRYILADCEKLTQSGAIAAITTEIRDIEKKILNKMLGE